MDLCRKRARDEYEEDGEEREAEGEETEAEKEEDSLDQMKAFLVAVTGFIAAINCLGATDGTHVSVTIRAAERPRYRNRKGDITTNVLGACSPDMRFIYVLPGWEGSASDSRVLRDALSRNHRLVIPNDKYYLVDAGYANGPGFLAPYRGTRYHLKEWSGNCPQNYKELFNLRHSKARNVIERAFGVLKKRWSILRIASFFDIRTQVRIINACCVLHNFIRIEKHNDPLLEAEEFHILDLVDRELAMRPIEINEEEVRTVEATNEWTAFRDRLAMDMFVDYRRYRVQQVHQEQREVANVP
ncbi:protein ALP1-like [Argentina anserina]|uniref:protein ALP1-like n=1 Tax=Argentina anserina TaxID=57926 RepID=UPI0021769176|nr:protein ALP1-like [Potentilla anserina]